MEETGAGWGEYCFRQLPSAPAEVRGHPLHLWTEDGRWKLWNYEGKKEKNRPKWQTPGRGGSNIDAVSFRKLPEASADVRGHPRTSVDIRGMCGGKMEAGELRG